MFYNVLHCEWYLPLEIGPQNSSWFQILLMAPQVVWMWSVDCIPRHGPILCPEAEMLVFLWPRHLKAMQLFFLRNSGWGATTASVTLEPPQVVIWNAYQALGLLFSSFLAVTFPQGKFNCYQNRFREDSVVFSWGLLKRMLGRNPSLGNQDNRWFSKLFQRRRCTMYLDCCCC